MKRTSVAYMSMLIMPGETPTQLAPKARGEASRRWRCEAAALLAVVACALSACSSTSDSSMTLFVNSGKYQYHSCDQIAAQIKGQNARRTELKGLIDRAERGTGGVVVGALAYRTDYLTVGEELQVLEATARSKNCAMPADSSSSTAIH